MATIRSLSQPKGNPKPKVPKKIDQQLKKLAQDQAEGRYLQVTTFIETVQSEYDKLMAQVSDEKSVVITVSLPNGNTLAVTRLANVGPDLVLVEGVDAEENQAIVLIPLAGFYIVMTVRKTRQKRPISFFPHSPD